MSDVYVHSGSCIHMSCFFNASHTWANWTIPHFKRDNEAHVVFVSKCKSNEVRLCMQEDANTASSEEHRATLCSLRTAQWKLRAAAPPRAAGMAAEISRSDLTPPSPLTAHSVQREYWETQCLLCSVCSDCSPVIGCFFYVIPVQANVSWKTARSWKA